jgi:hypothetical protein
VSAGQIVRMQRVMREVNDRIRGIADGQGAEESEFMCECGRDDCHTTFTVMLADRDAARAQDFFLVAPGHLVGEVDSLVESRLDYDLVAQKAELSA